MLRSVLAIVFVVAVLLAGRSADAGPTCPVMGFDIHVWPATMTEPVYGVIMPKDNLPFSTDIPWAAPPNGQQVAMYMYQIQQIDPHSKPFYAGLQDLFRVDSIGYIQSNGRWYLRVYITPNPSLTVTQDVIVRTLWIVC